MVLLLAIQLVQVHEPRCSIPLHSRPLASVSIENEQLDASRWDLNGSATMNTTAVRESDVIQPLGPSTNSTLLSDDLRAVAWINGTSMATFRGTKFDQNDSRFPATSFPFSRLAGCYAASSSSSPPIFYIYHQLNATIIAEEVFDPSIGNWASNNITVPNS